MHRIRLLPFVLAILAPASFAATGEDFAIDPVHTRVMVGVEHAGFSHALGVASGSTGTVHFAEGWADAKVDVRIPLDRLDFGDAAWTRAVRGLLDVPKFPQARFVSTGVTPRDATHAQVCGDFTLHGITRPLCMDATFNALRRHPMPPFRRTAGFSATAHLDRTEFGIEQWKNVIGRDVEVRIELEASRGIGAPDAGKPTPETDGVTR